MKRHANIPIFVADMGCPHRCVYCNQKMIAQVGGAMTPELADEIILKALKTMDDRDVQIAFFGGSFSGIPFDEQCGLLKTAKKYVDMGLVTGIRLSTRPDLINEKILDNFKKYSVTSVELGVQSMDDEVLKLNRRGNTVNDVENGAKMVKAYGFELGLQMMIGLIDDTCDKSIYTANKIVEFGADTARIYPTLVIKDTPLCELYEKGLYQPLKLDEAVLWSADILKIFEDADIAVLRIGLMANEGLDSGKSLIAGPYHPAFGEMVKSRLMLNHVIEQLKEYRYDRSRLKIIVPAGEISHMVGIKRENISLLKEKFGINDIRVREDISLKHGEIMFDDLV